MCIVTRASNYQSLGSRNKWKRVVLLKLRSLGKSPAEFGPRALQRGPCLAGAGASGTWRKGHMDVGPSFIGSDIAENALRDCF